MRVAAEAGILRCMQRVHIHQILTPHTPRAELDPGFEVLDNSANERPDWYEYWPIRNYLLRESLDEGAYYGFLSPRFAQKTNLEAKRVRDFILAADPAADVVLFSPSIHNSAYYWNVFEHGEAEHPGLMGTAKTLFARLGLPGDLDMLVTDSRNTVFSNYFIAKPRFWREWLAINEKMFAIAEAPGDVLGEALRTPTTYRGGSAVQMKVFIMERMATWLLATSGAFKAQVRDPFAARSRIYKLPLAIVCDALKIAHATQGRMQYKQVFTLVRATRGFMNAQIRLGAALKVPALSSAIRELKSYWARDGA
jgi:hypothetical protein